MKKNINNTNLFLSIIFFLFLTSGCGIVKKNDAEDVFKCYNSDGAIEVGYRSPAFFDIKDYQYADTLKKGYVKIYFPNGIEDTVEVFFNNRKVTEYWCKKNSDPDEHIYYDFSGDKRSPVLTIRPKNNHNSDCLQILIDDRYRLLFISKIEDVWYINYSNFHVPTI